MRYVGGGGREGVCYKSANVGGKMLSNIKSNKKIKVRKKKIQFNNK